MKKIKKCLICGGPIKNQESNGGGCTLLHSKVVFNYGYYDKGEFYISPKGKEYLEKHEKKVV